MSEYLPPTVASYAKRDDLAWQLWCKGCGREGFADLPALAAAGYGERRLIDLKFRCSRCNGCQVEGILRSFSPTQEQWTVTRKRR